MLAGRAGQAVRPDISADPFWDDVVLLIQGTTSDDLSASGHTVTAPLGINVNDTTTKKFTSSLDFDLNDELNISLASTADFDFLDGDFTIEMWINIDSGGTNDNYFSVGDTSGNYSISWHFQAGSNLRVRYSSDGTSLTSWNVGAVGPTAGQFDHIALVRDGDTLRYYKNGVQQGVHSMVFGFSLFASNEIVSIGDGLFWNASTSKFVEDIRVTKGVCRYPDGASFTPPTENFPTS